MANGSIEEGGKRSAIQPIGDEYALLSKEDLMRIDEEEPKWYKIRVSIVVAFWIIWAGLCVGAGLHIGLTARCPARPHQEFWQSCTGYWLNPFSYKDSNGDKIGDLKGLVEAVDYLKSNVGVEFVILTPLEPLQQLKLQGNSNITFQTMHPSLGSEADFVDLVRTFKKKGLRTVVSLNFNSVPLSHYLYHECSFKPPQGFCRYGQDCMRRDQCYSSYGTGSHIVDLDLTKLEVLKEIYKAVRFWLLKGADGILLEDAAFYIKNGTCKDSSWESSFPTCRLYLPGTVSIIQGIRKVVDEISSKTKRHRVLIAEPGDTGYDPSYAEVLLGTKENPGAHLIISRHFVYQRGTDVAVPVRVDAYEKSANTTIRNQLALPVSTPIDKPHGSVTSLTSIFLLPGTPILYAGSELGWAPVHNAPRKEIIPFEDSYFTKNYIGYLPMPWDQQGIGFSKNATNFEEYLTELKISETVETVMAAGRKESVFSLTHSLVALRKKTPSLLWGDLETNLTTPHNPALQILKRSAEGFDSIVAVMVSVNDKTSVVDFSSHCSAITPLIVYPTNSAFQLDKEMLSTRVFIKEANSETVYIFKCKNR